MNRTTSRLVNTFVTGLLAALPLAATIAIFVWGARLLYTWLGPGSLIGGGLAAIGLGVTGSEVAGYSIGVAIVLAAVFGLGLLVNTRLSGLIETILEGLIRRIPLVGSVYELIRKFVELLGQRDAQGTRTMSPVWLTFGGPGKAAVLALLASTDEVDVGGEPYLGVLIPTAPVPVGGALLYVPKAWVVPAPVGMEALTSIYVSMGVTAGEHLRRVAPSASASASPSPSASGRGLA
jgi:uncharacterized membrane protein